MSQNLEQLLQSVKNPVDLLRNSRIGAYVYPVVPTEYTNWRDEQKAWRDSAVLFDQSHHMAELLVTGPDAFKMLNYLASNSFKGFVPNKAKQFAPLSYDGYVIGDVIMFYHAENEFNLVGRAPTVNWVQFQAETGGFDVQVRRDDRSPSNPKGAAIVRQHYRYQIQGPNAWGLLEKLNGGPIPDIKFFNMDYISIGGQKVRALRHGMAGAPGLEIWGPYADREKVKDTILAAGDEFGLVQVGARAYATNTLESGWIPSPLPAVYSGEKMKKYREWLPASGYEATASIGGSFVSNDIEDYYLTPYELGYGVMVKFDHDFVGREALEQHAKQPQRKKVTFAWNADDVARVLSSIVQPGEHYKYIELPLSNYASSSYDAVTKNGRTVGLSMFSGISYNERSMLSLGVVDPDVEIGEELALVWGEENGGTKKTTVERHKQTEIRVTVSPVPYSKVVQTTYAAGWRQAAATRG
jgi:vanillate/3-O-methylgallate O-demethylase